MHLFSICRITFAKKVGERRIVHHAAALSHRKSAALVLYFIDIDKLACRKLKTHLGERVAACK
jgi:hypothetical protein